MKRFKRPAYTKPYDRPQQEAPIEMVDDLLETIRRQFYGEISAERWAQDKYFLKIHVVTWPAQWLTERGVTLPPTRYQEILQGIFQGIKQHGKTGEVTHWPRYLTYCVQQHFKHHEDEIYAEAKSVRLAIERAVSRLQPATGPRPDLIASIAQVHQLMRHSRARARKPSPEKAAVRQEELGL
jgi:hypothetical protein